MRHAILLAALGCLAVLGGSPANAQSGPDAEICATNNYDLHTPAQRVAACTALIDAAKDAPAPELSKLLLHRGVAYWYVNEKKRGLDDLDRAVALDPKNEIALRERARLFGMSGRYDQGLVDVNEAIRLDPKDSIAFTVRGNIFQ